ncbi:MAG TPA: AtpZ/AtpI family protein [Thermodesulfobacteriota bacterium]|nr:AtpZ/AtpI family protein [Deltaproteobacteria bacterium]HNU70678.1 AtpZ/AtpI family protein [Thermodesulfobacteriota bacterium]
MNNKQIEQFGIFFALAIDLTISLVGGFVVGYWLDSHFHTFPWLTVIFFLGGIAAAVNTGIFIVKRFRKFSKE